MSQARTAYVGLDTGTSLALLAYWTGEPGEETASHGRSWPLRARIEAVSASLTTTPAELARSIRELCAPHAARPEECFLVSMGRTCGERASELAGSLGMRGVIEPVCPCVLWTEGVLPAHQVLEYARPVPPGQGGIRPTADLDALRACFAGLMEQAADDVQRLGLDQDDSLLDRFVDLRPHGRPDVLTVPVASLTDPARLLRPFHAALAARYGQAEDQAPVEVLTARMRCIITTPG